VAGYLIVSKPESGRNFRQFCRAWPPAMWGKRTSHIPKTTTCSAWI